MTPPNLDAAINALKADRPSSHRIVAAAIKVGDTIYQLPPPARHHTIMSYMRTERGFKGVVQPDEQGFVDSNGEFVSRWFAYRVADGAGQLLKPRRIGVDQECYSEDLW